MLKETDPPVSARLDRIKKASDDLVRVRRGHQAPHRTKPATEQGPTIFPYVIDSPRRAAIITLSGTVRRPALVETIDAIFHDPVWQPGFSRVWVGTAITELLIEKRDLTAFVAFERQQAALAGTGREVIILEHELDRVIARIYVVMMRHEGRAVYICDTEAEAWRWLGQPMSLVL